MFYVMRNGMYFKQGTWTDVFTNRTLWGSYQDAAIVAKNYYGEVCVGDVHGVDFGRSSIFGDISIGDVAGGDITKFGR